jgi:hypothetical protein
MGFLARLTDGQEVVVTADPEDKNFTVITGAGATATVSRVDDEYASEHTSGAANQFSVAASTRTVTPLDWPHYLVSVAGGSCRVATV